MKIHILDLAFQNLEHTIAAFVLEASDGLALVESGPYSTYHNLETALEMIGFKPSDIRQVFLTHIHFDHAGAAWALARQGAKIYVHPRGLPHLASPEKLYNSARMIYGDAMENLWGAMEAIPESQLYAPGHGETIDTGGLQFTAWYTPGHAVHHIAWAISPAGANPNEAVLFTGDVAGVCINGQIAAPPCPPPDIDIEAWQASLQLIRNLPAESLYLTHFGIVTAKQAHLDELESRLLAWAEWMKPYAAKQTPPADIVPAFEAYVRAEMLAAGMAEASIARYETANPAFMSVAGLMRYWAKKQMV